MKAPRFDQVAPWARLLARVNGFCSNLGICNNIALVVVRPPLPFWTFVLLTFWWLPLALANLVTQMVMFRWAMALVWRERLKRLEKLR